MHNNEIVISALATPDIGTGHLRRMISLARALQSTTGRLPRFHTSVLGAQILAASALPISSSDILIAPDDPSQAVIGLAKHLANIRPAATLLDNYFWSEVQEALIRPHAGKLCVIDDLANRNHLADLLLDQNPRASASDYQARVPKHCRLLIGTPYCLIDQSFQDLRTAGVPTPQERTKLSPIFISLGGGDPNRDLVRLVRLCLEETSRPLTIATGSHIADAAQLTDLAKVHEHRVELIFDSTRVAQQMNKSCYAVASGGTMTWERAVLGLPSLSLMLVDNQVEATLWAAQNGFQSALDLRPEWSDVDFVSALQHFNANPELREKYSAAALSLIDGAGSTRVAIEIQRLLATT